MLCSEGSGYNENAGVTVFSFPSLLIEFELSVNKYSKYLPQNTIMKEIGFFKSFCINEGKKPAFCFCYNMRHYHNGNFDSFFYWRSAV